MTRALSATLVVVLVGTVARAEAPQPPRLRLGDAARPARYAVRLRVVPGEPTFSGVVDVDLVLKAPSNLVWMNGTRLEVKAARFEVAGKTIEAKPVPGGEDFLGFGVAAPLPAGPARLHVEYSGSVSLKDDRGLFAQKEGERWYAVTQLESIAARRVFPCFDEPSFKVPWQLTLEVPRADAVFSNTAPVSEREEHPGMKTVTFAPTRPLPSYLVAFAIGPYDVVDAGRAGQNKIVSRIAAPHGRGADTRFAASVTSEIVACLEDYFGTPFPYDKLDQVSVPLPSSFAAMENPGMVTWAQSVIVARPEDLSLGFQRYYVDVAAHELAHQWFGDLVTTRWWDDIWLNESFASWLASKVVDQLHPDWNHGTHTVEVRNTAMTADSLVSARQIRQPIAGNDDIYNAFDVGITYSKGEVVLGMFEHFIGADTFRKGIRKYIADHADGNAGADDFIAAMSAAAGRDLAPAFRTFLDQPGVPLVKVGLSCPAGKPPALAVVQERYLPLGAGGAAPQTWHVPLCVKWSAGGEVNKTCTLVTEPRATVPLAGPCPAWVLANDGGGGYYRVAYQGELLTRLLAAKGKIDLAETVSVLDDLSAFVDNGTLPIGEALAFVPALASDPKRQVVDNGIGLAKAIRDRLVPEALRPNYVRFVQKHFGPRAHQLGWKSGRAEDDDTRLLRPPLLSLVADSGEDRRLRAEAIELSRRWLADRTAIEPELVDAVLGTAARAGDRKLFDLFRAEAGRAQERRDRVRLFGAMARFTDPELAGRALAILADEAFDARETATIIYTASYAPRTRALAWDYLKKNFDVLARRWPPESLAYLPFVATSFCDEEHRADMLVFFKDRSPTIPGGPRILAQASEAAGICLAFKNAQAKSAAQFLRRY